MRPNGLTCMTFSHHITSVLNPRVQLYFCLMGVGHSIPSIFWEEATSLLFYSQGLKCGSVQVRR